MGKFLAILDNSILGWNPLKQSLEFQFPCPERCSSFSWDTASDIVVLPKKRKTCKASKQHGLVSHRAVKNNYIDLGLDEISQKTNKTAESHPVLVFQDSQKGALIKKLASRVFTHL